MHEKKRRFFLRDILGISLIEIMAVMFILGLITSVVIPSLEKWFLANDEMVTRVKIAGAIQSLIIRVALLEEDFELSNESLNNILSDKKPALILPEGWQMENNKIIKLWRSGVCEKNTISFLKSGKKLDLDIEKNSCLVSIVK